jgi:hypothetical protein
VVVFHFSEDGRLSGELIAPACTTRDTRNATLSTKLLSAELANFWASLVSSTLCFMSSDKALYQEEKPRSIFRAYWDKKGNRNHDASAQTKELDRGNSSSFFSSSSNTYELSLELREKTADKCQSSPNSHRRIFSKLSKSTPTLSLTAALDVNMRKNMSISSLHGKPKGSCLRPARLSGCEGRYSEASDSSVTFSTEVDIVVFQTPAERWAADGWSDWFA